MKLIILAMSCDIPFFLKEEELVKETWAKDILDKKYPDVDFFFIRTSENERIEDNYIYVNTPDDIMHTLNKNIRAFELLEENNIKYDFILRTNLSTYININTIRKFLLDECIPKFRDYAHLIITSEIVSTGKKNGPRGNFMLIHYGIIKSLIYLFNNFYNDRLGLDDALMGDILYPAVMFRTVEYYEFFKDSRYYKNSYIDSVDQIRPQCFFVSYRYYTDAMAIGYLDREKIEFETCRKIHEYFLSNKTDDINNNLTN